ncbi:general stress protein 14 [Tetragenococcus halophilus subsp. flandriensis]|uniref:NAD(P)H-dependent oxidoreductase n=1 Tax=Tetragenococcus halophilus TaxID=51669 RepID=UPI0023E90E59|nr:NAD(P)H-dependent oxidoreductase [Tetragenococcus halophilus]GMA08412.1 general stress protein 14 [Tetragenococcus halophilus subsp. flandriensis]
MKTLVLIFHPNLTESRGNRRLSQEIDKYSDVTLHNVYASYPDGKIDVKAEQQLVEEHDRIIFQFPFYWYSAPALLKKWLEEVIVYGWAFGTNGDKMQNKEFLPAVTTGVDQEGYSAEGLVKFSVPELLRPLEATTNFVGAYYLAPFVVHGVGHQTDEQIEEKAKHYASYALSAERIAV